MDIEDKLVIAKLEDKIKLCKTRNKIVNTEFLTIYQKDIIQKELNRKKLKNYLFFGGYDGAEGEVLVIYPEKLGLDITKASLESIIKAVKIKLPKELKGKYTHREYLGSVMQTGLNRNRIGDIIVHDDMAYIIVLEENAEYIVNFLKELTRFSKAEIETVNYNEIKIKESEFDEITVTISSMRLDNLVSELAKISRTKAEVLLSEEKVFINSKCETKSTKPIKEKDILVIRGKGKFIIDKILGNNKKGKIVVEIKKYR
ncbi:MAG: hypothetical protein K2H53_02970 [Clostridia bacterium]|nr:hypothetical protein [Clostridia bacterium]